MIESRPLATFLAHLTLLIGVLVVGLPLYLTFVASTHTPEAIVQNVPMPLVPGDHFAESYKLALSTCVTILTKAGETSNLLADETAVASATAPATRSNSGFGARNDDDDDDYVPPPPPALDALLLQLCI